MVVVHRAYGYRFVIYTMDHEPAHVHIVGDGQAKVNLAGAAGRPELVFNVGIKRSDLKRLFAEIVEHRVEMLNAWERIHGHIDRR